jgi:hypothetical protein
MADSLTLPVSALLVDCAHPNPAIFIDEDGEEIVLAGVLLWRNDEGISLMALGYIGATTPDLLRSCTPRPYFTFGVEKCEIAPNEILCVGTDCWEFETREDERDDAPLSKRLGDAIKLNTVALIAAFPAVCEAANQFTDNFVE